MKKYIAAVVLAAAFLSGCNKEETAAPADTDAEVTQVSDETIQEPDTDATPAPDIIPEEPWPDEDPDAAEITEFKDELVHNDLFGAHLVEFDLPEGGEEMVTLIFEFENITDKTFFKNDEEIPAGGSWEKTITYPREKWADMAGEACWIHYDLYEDGQMQTQIYKGGLKFTVSDDLQVSDISLFED